MNSSIIHGVVMKPVVFNTEASRRDAHQHVEDMLDKLAEELVLEGIARAKANTNRVTPTS